MPRQKSAAEIVAIESAQRATETAMADVIEYLRTSVAPTSEEAHAIIDRVLLEHDCDSPEGHIVAGGAQAVEPHERGHGRINHGEAIVIDIFPRSKTSGYFADMTRTVCIGEPSEELQKMYDTVLGAQELAISMLAPSVACKSVQVAVEKYFVEKGYETSGKGKEFSFAEGFVHSIGHGVGREVHEPPYFSKKRDDVLMVGDVVTVEPGLYYKNIGGVRIEDLLVITEDGHRNLTNFSKNLSVRR
jgi:Xaa-Pro aminopeptidase